MVFKRNNKRIYYNLNQFFILIRINVLKEQYIKKNMRIIKGKFFLTLEQNVHANIEHIEHQFRKIL